MLLKNENDNVKPNIKYKNEETNAICWHFLPDLRASVKCQNN